MVATLRTRTSYRQDPGRPSDISGLDNSELIQRCKKGLRPDPIAFRELMHRYASHVHKILYHLASDWSDREDLAQEVWIRVYDNISALKEVCKFRGWLSRIATNLFYDELRKRKRVRYPLSLDAPRAMDDGEVDWEVASNDPDPQDNLLTGEFLQKVEAAIAEVTPQFREAIRLREYEGLPYEEIARRTQVSIGTVKSRIARARGQVARKLEPYLKGDMPNPKTCGHERD